MPKRSQNLRLFSEKLLDDLKAAASRYYVWDADTPRLGVMVTPAGTKSYYYRYRDASGTDHRRLLGTVGVLKLKDARAAAAKFAAALAQGQDLLSAVEQPATADVPAPAKRTVAAMAERFERDYVPGLKPASQRMYKWCLRAHIVPQLGTKRVDALACADVAGMHRQIVAAGHGYAANRARAVLSVAWNQARSWGWIPADKRNPCEGVQRAPEFERDRPVRETELAALGAALDALEAARGDLWRGTALTRLWLFTGARMNEIMGARWDWVDEVRCLLLLPARKGKVKPVALTPPALAVLNALPSRGKSPWLFPGNRPGQPMKNPRKTFALLLEAAEVQGLRIHDLRHIFGSMAGSKAGASQVLIRDILGHTNTRTTERYTRGVGSDAYNAAAKTAAIIETAMAANKKPAG